jgi:hypothetical protein
MRFLAQFLEDGFVADEFTGVVVHHENVDLVVHGLTDAECLSLRTFPNVKD